MATSSGVFFSLSMMSWKARQVSGGFHREVEKVLFEAGLDRVLGIAQNEDRQLIVGSEHALLDQAMDRVEPSSARDDAVMSLFARHRHADEVLADALDGNIRLELGIGDGIADSSNVARGLGEVRRGHEDG